MPKFLLKFLLSEIVILSRTFVVLLLPGVGAVYGHAGIHNLSFGIVEAAGHEQSLLFITSPIINLTRTPFKHALGQELGEAGVVGACSNVLPAFGHDFAGIVVTVKPLYPVLISNVHGPANEREHVLDTERIPVLLGKELEMAAQTGVHHDLSAGGGGLVQTSFYHRRGNGQLAAGHTTAADGLLPVTAHLHQFQAGYGPQYGAQGLVVIEYAGKGTGVVQRDLLVDRLVEAQPVNMPADEPEQVLIKESLRGAQPLLNSLLPILMNGFL